ncbi:unnamed protein product [Rotaria sordida]|uniref:Uncharacterized protein n=1 Tax=Rotaria sordida TaxID=392033 RepID=A0A814LXY0_9BILA|nr:unnamed protein product [Rotaria sordida]CAF1094082.1 unnamed protein product [Rotaria sordida]CAF3884097.1 unnamed protein product [Rotaria sordida]
MHNTFLYYLLLSASTLSVVISDLAQFGWDQKANPQDYNGPWGEGVKCPYGNPPFPDGTTVYTGSVPPAMTTDAVNYLRDTNVKIFQVSETKTYPDLTNLYFVMRKEFHTWHYSGGKLLTGCWTGVTVYQYINHP